MPRKWLCLLPCALLALTSCGMQRYPVEGKVALDGKPLKTGTVLFWGGDGKASRSAKMPTAQIREDGRYAIFTEGGEGAPVGTYKVTIHAEEATDSTKPDKGKSLVPKKYTQPDSTPLTITVVQYPKQGAYDLNLNKASKE